MPGIYRLKGVVKHYDWGGYSFIPALLNIENKYHQPSAGCKKYVVHTGASFQRSSSN